VQQQAQEGVAAGGEELLLLVGHGTLRARGGGDQLWQRR
jgi:hypothetical protein